MLSLGWRYPASPRNAPVSRRADGQSRRGRNVAVMPNGFPSRRRGGDCCPRRLPGITSVADGEILLTSRRWVVPAHIIDEKAALPTFCSAIHTGLTDVARDVSLSKQIYCRRLRVKCTAALSVRRADNLDRIQVGIRIAVRPAQSRIEMAYCPPKADRGRPKDAAGDTNLQKHAAWLPNRNRSGSAVPHGNKWQSNFY